MKKKILLISIILICHFLLLHFVNADVNLTQKLSGRILLQVQNNGEAWYINPADLKRYYLGRPSDAFEIMRSLGMGISEKDFNSYNGIAPENLSGKIILRVEKNGEAYYINPDDLKLYYLGTPQGAFNVMGQLGLGITNENIKEIPIGTINNKIKNNQLTNINPLPHNQNNSSKNALNNAAKAILANNFSETKKYFVAGLQDRLKYSMNYWGTEQRYDVASLLLNAKLVSSNGQVDTYSTQAYFSLGDSNVPIKFIVEKQPDGSWLLTNL